MQYACRILLCALLCVGAFTLYSLESNNERTKMNNPSPQFAGKDKNNQPIIIEWQKTSLIAPEFATAMAGVWDIARPAYVPVEMIFLKAFPGVVGKEPYFKLFEPLFKNGIEQVNWAEAESSMINVLKGHFVFDVSKFSEAMIKMFADDVCYFVTIKDGISHQKLGFITLLIRKNYAAGDVKIMSLAVDPAYQNCGLGKILMSSVFKIVPDVKRLFLCTRVTNEIALRAYRSWGFVIDPDPILDHAFNLEHWMFMHYVTQRSSTLQDIAQKFV